MQYVHYMLTARLSNSKILVISLAIFTSIACSLLLLNQATCRLPSDTLALRFCQGFPTIFALIPISIMALGGTIVSIVILERKTHRRDINYKMLLCGITVVFLGMGMLGFILID